MPLFRKHDSTLRFSQSVREIDYFQLYALGTFSAAFSKLEIAKSSAEIQGYWATAIGLLSDNHGDNHPLLPLTLIFAFCPNEFDLTVPFTKKFGTGIVEKSLRIGDLSAYEATLVINDSERKVFDAFRSGFENALRSDNSFFEVEFRNSEDRRSRSALDVDERKAWEKELEADLIARELQDKELPELVFDEIHFEDAMYLKAPTWTRSWNGDSANRTIYHHSGAAKWRKRKHA